MDRETRKRKAEILAGRECRRAPAAKIEIRESDEGKLSLAGYASVFDVEYDMGWYTEIVRRGAFTKTLSEKPDVQLLINHTSLPLARTTTGSLRLSEDDYGLKVEADLDPEDVDVARLAPKMRRGDINEMSFAFWTVRHQWDEDYEKRELLEVKIDRGDVSVVNYGANPSTSVDLRSLDAIRTLAGVDPEAVLAEIRAGNADPIVLLEQARDAVEQILNAAKPAEEEDPDRGYPLELALSEAALL